MITDILQKKCDKSMYILEIMHFFKEKLRRRLPPPDKSLLAEGLAVGALVHGRVGFMGAHHDAIQGTVVLGVAVIGALLNGAFDALIGMTIHGSFLLLS
jgi:hypothetical protein